MRGPVERIARPRALWLQHSKDSAATLVSPVPAVAITPYGPWDFGRDSSFDLKSCTAAGGQRLGLNIIAGKIARSDQPN